MDSANSLDSTNGLDVLGDMAYDNHLIMLIEINFIQNNKDLAQQYCEQLINKNKDEESIKRLIDYYFNDQFKPELFEFVCWAFIKHNNNIYCLDKLAYYYLEKYNYINAFNCYIVIIIKSDINSSNITICIDIFNSIFDIIKRNFNANLIFTQLLANINFQKSVIPLTHKNIFDQIVKSIEKYIR